MKYKDEYKYDRVIIKLELFLGSGLTAYDLINNIHKDTIYKLKKEIKIAEFIHIDASDFYIEIPKAFYTRVFYGIRKKMGDKEFFRRLRMYSKYNDGIEDNFRKFSGIKYNPRSDWAKKEYLKHVGLV